MGIDDEDFMKIVREIESEEKKLIAHPLFQVLATAFFTFEFLMTARSRIVLKSAAVKV